MTTLPDVTRTPEPMRDRWVLPGLLLLTVVLRLPQIAAPIADHLQAKQAYTALRARAIARPPFNPLRNTLDLLDDQGQPLTLAEEVPVYCTLVALAHRTVGEQPASARLWSLDGSLVAVAAFYRLVRAQSGPRLAAVAALVLTAAPLFVFYGRAVMPDSWMLGLMLTSAMLYQRHLETGSRRAWLGTAACAALAALFKYYGLMVLLVLAQMTWSRDRSGLSRKPFGLLAVAVTTPVALWMSLVFLQIPNPLVTGWVPGTDRRPYLIFQNPEVLFRPAFYAGLWRFVAKDLGPISAGLLMVGLVSAVRKRELPAGFAGLLAGWSTLALVFYLILGPKLIDHDYYELMMLPAAALWAGLGWERLQGLMARQQNQAAMRAVSAGLLSLMVAVQSPWVLGEHFKTEAGKVELAQAIRQAVPAGNRVMTMSPSIGLISVLYESNHQGWTVPASQLREDWPEQLAQYRAHGATVLALYFDAKTTPAQRLSFDPLIRQLPTLAHVRKAGNAHQAGYEYLLLGLDDGILPRVIEADSDQ